MRNLITAELQMNASILIDWAGVWWCLAGAGVGRGGCSQAGHSDAAIEANGFCIHHFDLHYGLCHLCELLGKTKPIVRE